MGRFSRKEAESNGWVIVHEDEGQGHYRAEKYIDSNTKIEASGVSEGKLLESINAQEQHRASFVEPEDKPVDETGQPLDEAGFPLRTVLAPDDEALTDREWSTRGAGDVIVDEDGTRTYGPTEAAARADDRRQEIATEVENQKKAEPDNGPTGQIEQESARDHQLQDVLVVREGEESLGEVIDRKADESATAESERAAAGLGIGPINYLPQEGEEHGEIVLEPVPMGGPADYFDPSELPAGVDSASEQVEIREDAEVDKAEELRDEHGKQADKPEFAGEIAEAGSEAQQDAKDEAENDQADESEAPASTPEAETPSEEDSAPEQGQPQEGDIEASPAAKELAKEKGVDLKNVKGSGAEGKVTKPDVESHLEAQGKK
jgi:pyruvate/2-oxoglutarate dehydrogenase complex dihydrolipoamide acyltransferase (E2) component